ncbi:wax ester/triacylglycerol synthase domain-containing protein [Nocardia thailandica]|uniref:wax ester/triacylglycerol synthase domain-containing protein n=1 Tax=Nocardia thailandica TaxID=257275 RepID=UPI00031260D0|nr:wax ester/triacylglycerol synthase domain-containing protein [Nocardia thailandica]
MTRLAPRDATMYWLSRRAPNDLFLVYCFADSGASAEDLRTILVDRSARIDDLRLRLRTVAGNLEYPRWEFVEFGSRQLFGHEEVNLPWPSVSARLGELLGTGLDATRCPWRAHVFRGVDGAPATDGPSVVVVLQLSHALADGTRAAAIARALFAPGMDFPKPVDNPVDHSPEKPTACGQLGSAVVDNSAIAGIARFPNQLRRTVIRGTAAGRARRELAGRTAAGEIPAPTVPFAPTALNPPHPVDACAHRAGVRVYDAAELRVPGYTVTVSALTAISRALERFSPADRLGAQVPMALPGAGAAGNHYRGLSIDLRVDEPDLRVRAAALAESLRTRRARATHPLQDAQDAVDAVVPAVFAARDIARADLSSVPGALDGNTVVSSVHRGPADLALAGGDVRWTGGFPALGTVMHLTHGVHGLGDTVTLSVHADAAVLPDPERYLALLDSAVAEVGAALRDGSGGST